MTADRVKVNDGRWHAMTSFTTRPIPVRTMAGTQYHRGTHAGVTRWTGTKWVYERCGCIHKTRNGMLACGQRQARWLNRQLDHQAAYDALTPAQQRQYTQFMDDTDLPSGKAPAAALRYAQATPAAGCPDCDCADLTTADVMADDCGCSCHTVAS